MYGKLTETPEKFVCWIFHRIRQPIISLLYEKFSRGTSEPVAFSQPASAILELPDSIIDKVLLSANASIHIVS